MSDLISKALFSGLGLASLTKDAIQKTVTDLVSQSKISEDEGRRLVHELQQRTTHAQKTMEKKIETAVNKVLKNVHLTTLSAKKRMAKAAGKPAKKTRRHHAAKKAAKA